MSGIISDNKGRSTGLIKAAAGGLFSNFQSYNFTTGFNFTGSGNDDPEDYTNVTGFLDVITPTSASSDIFVMCKIACHSGNDGFFSMTRAISGGATTALEESFISASGGRTRTLTADCNTNFAAEMQDNMMIFKDSPATTSAVTYQVTCAVWTNATIYVNSATQDTDDGYVGEAMSNITLMEMA